MPRAICRGFLWYSLSLCSLTLQVPKGLILRRRLYLMSALPFPPGPWPPGTITPVIIKKGVVEENRRQMGNADLFPPMHTHEILLQLPSHLYPVPSASSALSLSHPLSSASQSWPGLPPWSVSLTACPQAGQGLSRPAGVSVAVGRRDRQDSRGKEEGGRSDLVVS